MLILIERPIGDRRAGARRAQNRPPLFDTWGFRRRGARRVIFYLLGRYRARELLSAPEIQARPYCVQALLASIYEPATRNDTAGPRPAYRLGIRRIYHHPSAPTTNIRRGRPGRRTLSDPRRPERAGGGSRRGGIRTPGFRADRGKLNWAPLRLPIIGARSSGPTFHRLAHGLSMRPAKNRASFAPGYPVGRLHVNLTAGGG